MKAREKKERPKTPARPPKPTSQKPDSKAALAVKRKNSSKIAEQPTFHSGDLSAVTLPSESGFAKKKSLKEIEPTEDEKKSVDSESESEESQREEEHEEHHQCCGHKQSSRRRKSPGKKKLVMLSRKVLDEVKKNPNSTGTQIANDIISFYKNLHGKKLDFKNVQRRVYDALNVFAALGIINKERNNIEYTGTKRPKPKSPTPSSQIPQKAQLLKELCMQFMGIRKLLERNYHGDH